MMSLAASLIGMKWVHTANFVCHMALAAVIPIVYVISNYITLSIGFPITFEIRSSKNEYVVLDVLPIMSGSGSVL